MTSEFWSPFFFAVIVRSKQGSLKFWKSKKKTSYDLTNSCGCVFNIWHHIGHCGSSEPQVDEDVARVLRECVANGKPIGLCCIAPIVAALVLAKEDGMSLKMTLGRRSGEGWPYAATIDKAVEFGITHVEMDVDEVSDSFFYLEICMILQSLVRERTPDGVGILHKFCCHKLFW